MKGIFDALTTNMPRAHALHGGFQWKCVNGHLMATLSGTPEDQYRVGNHKPLKPTHPGIRYPNPTKEEYEGGQTGGLAYFSRLEKIKPEIEAAHNASLVSHDAAHKAYCEAIEAEHDACIIIPEDQSQLSPTNLICHCGSGAQK